MMSINAMHHQHLVSFHHVHVYRDCIDEDYIKTLFASTGGGVQNFRFFQYVSFTLHVFVMYMYLLNSLIFVWKYNQNLDFIHMEIIPSS